MNLEPDVCGARLLTNPAREYARPTNLPRRNETILPPCIRSVVAAEVTRRTLLSSRLIRLLTSAATLQREVGQQTILFLTGLSRSSKGPR